ncbi:GatB/YqeY domain-containing protein [Collinsella sp. AGMB00827]|uniref:GatB/YqeY domain-containing protein n=1 Tax=Collinsella ureilytica TaxID=2869515 RepID=A0ABS7MK72_9ACTN|nr:GatB/YqeY domain-containing protein [Collinsella urealyticum]MBY4797771.1 GatB/YqeY domain-containing protein [Collinsella urealyticum]
MKKEELKSQMIAAMKAKDKPRLSIIRQVMGEVTNIEVNERREASEADVDAMIKRLIKQTGETLEMSKQAGNDPDRTALLATQIEMLEQMLPEQVSGEALEELISRVLEETGATTKREMGQVMGALHGATGGNFDKPAAARILGERLA